MLSSKTTEKRSLSYVGKRLKESAVSYIFIMPFMVLFFVFVVLPVVISMFVSFTSFNILQPPKFIGADNYLRLFLKDSIFLKSIATTFVLAVCTGPVSFILSYIMAWMINEMSPKIRAVVTLILYAPSISGNVYLIWTVLFSGDDNGYINAFLLDSGFVSQPVQWLNDPRYMMGIVILVALWSSFGTGFLTFIAGLQGVDRSFYDASAVDGVKNRWQELWYVTLPLMRPQLLFGAVITIANSFGIGAITTALCGFPSNEYTVHTIMNHLDDYGTVRFEMGYACAIATILFAIMMIANVAMRKLIENIGK